VILPNNPVVFISLGVAENVMRHIKLVNEGIAFLHFSISATEDDTKKEIGRIWRKFLQEGNNSSDMIRINYVIETDEAALQLPIVRRLTEKHLNALYPAGVLTDIYCLIDEDRLLDKIDYRKEVIDILHEEQEANIYILSNLNSKNILQPKESAAKTIGLLTLFKDFTPDVYVTGADASRYNEFYFTDNCYAKGSKFLTASSIDITVPIRGLISLLAAEILSLGKDGSINNGTNLDESLFNTAQISQGAVPSLQFLYGLAVPETSTAGLTVQELLNTLFGTRLESLATPPVDEETPLPCLIESQLNFFDALRITSEDGLYPNIVRETLETEQTRYDYLNESFSIWLDSVPDRNNAKKRKLSPYTTQNTLAYDLAQLYLIKKSEIAESAAIISALSNKLEQIKKTHAILSTISLDLFHVVDELRSEAVILDDTFAPFTKDASSYFSALFKTFVKENEHDILELSGKLIPALMSGNLTEHLTLVEKYIQEVILVSPDFNKPIMDILQDLITDIDITSVISNWIFDNRQWDIRLKTGYANLHTEVNIHMPPKGAAEVKKRYEEQSLGKVNLFADTTTDSIAVLYHAGAFSLQDLYYSNLYEDLPRD